MTLEEEWKLYLLNLQGINDYAKKEKDMLDKMYQIYIGTKNGIIKWE